MEKKLKFKKVMKILILIYVFYILISQQLTMNNIKNEIKSQDVEVQKLKEKNQKLQDEVKMANSDMYIEKLARERLGLIKQGEAPVIGNK